MDDDGQRGEAEKKKRTIFGWYGQPCHHIVGMKRQRLLTILIRHVDSITDSVLIWDVDDDGQRGEVEKEKRTTSC